MKKPVPVHTQTVCSVCGLDWDRHGDKPTAETCIELLKQDLAREKQRAAPIQPGPYPLPYPVPYPVAPQPRPYRPWPWTQPGPIWISQPHIGTGSGTVPYPMTTGGANPVQGISAQWSLGSTQAH